MSGRRDPHKSTIFGTRWPDTQRVEILENDRGPSGGRILRAVVWSLFLAVCALAGSGIAEYQRLLPIAQERGLPTSILVKESFRHFDPASAAVGLLIGTAILATNVWVRRRREAAV